MRGLTVTPTRRAIVAVALLALVLGSACKKPAEEESATGYEPATVEPVEGSEELSRVILTEDAASVIELDTEQVATSDGILAVPESSIWIDTEGREWVYTSPQPLTFIRAEVVVDRYEGDQALLTSGPSVGTEVVTVGVPELIGSEFGI
jgi:hypothetical protein